MAVIIDSAGLLEVGAGEGVAAHVQKKPIPHFPPLNHYQVSGRVLIGANDSANTRLWELKNGGLNAQGAYVLPLRFLLQCTQTANGSGAPFLNTLELYTWSRVVLDTANIITADPQEKRTAPDLPDITQPDATIRYSNGTVNHMGSGAIAVTELLSTLEMWHLLTRPTTGVNAVTMDMLRGLTDGDHPLVIEPQDGLVLRNLNAGVIAKGLSVAWTFEWAEVAIC